MPAPELVDIGANLTNKAFASDLPGVLARASSAGVSRIIVTGTSVDASRRALDMARAQGIGSVALTSTAGIHPHHAKDASASALREIEALLHQKEVVFAGECGLDFNRNFSPPDAQIRAFEAQLEIAAAVKKPLFFHERDAHIAFLEIVKRHRSRIVGGVVHCFTGERRALEAYLDLDLHIGITGWICDERRGRHLVELAPLVPEGRLLIETDAPYLLPRGLPSPPPNRRNEPGMLPHVAAAVARARGESLDALAAHTTAAAALLMA